MKFKEEIITKRWVIRDESPLEGYNSEEDAKWCFFGGFDDDQWERVKFNKAVKFDSIEEARTVLREMFRRFFDVNEEVFVSEKSAALHFPWVVCVAEVVVRKEVDTLNVLGFKRRKEDV